MAKDANALKTTTKKSTVAAPNTLAIDGPAAAGKSALGERLAERLGYLFFDTGVLYRAVAYLALARKVDPTD
jgi:cytidylate kinase